MRVLVKMEIETPIYDGERFMMEIEGLLGDIRKDTGDGTNKLRLTKFRMHCVNDSIREIFDDKKSIVWREGDINV